MHLRFTTAGESHGKAFVTIVEGLPAGLPVAAEAVDRDLARRMQGYGRGARMKIERDRIEWLAGVRAGETLGSPVAMLIANRDWANWEDVMAPEAAEPGEIRRRRVSRPRPGHADLAGVLKYSRLDARDILERDRIEWLAGVRAGETLGSPVAMLIANRDWANWEDVMAPEAAEPGEIRRRRVSRPRPGHADLAGVLKYSRLDARDILERASARETAARVAAGALARRLLDEFGVEVGSHVVTLGGVAAARPAELPVPLNDAADRSEVRVLDPSIEAEIVRRIDEAKKAGDTLGGEVEVVARGVVVGLGSHVSWDRKLDGRLAGLLMSIPAVKGVEIGMGFEAARRPGSEVHDPITGAGAAAPPVAGDRRGGFRRETNNAGGLEGGITTGEPVVVRVAMKPISTLMSPLRTVDLSSGAAANAQSERSDVTAVPALGVIAEAMVALALADAMVEKFGGDSLGEMRRNYQAYVASLGDRWVESRGAAGGS